MKVELNVTNKEPEKSLKEVNMCQVFRFLDVMPDDLLSAISVSGEAFHFVHEGSKKVAGHKWIVSLDGEMIKCSPAWRPVALLGSAFILGEKASSYILLSNAGPGQVVQLKIPTSGDGLFMVAKGNPTPASKVILISMFTGRNLVVDDDIKVSHYPDAHFEKKIKF